MIKLLNAILMLSLCGGVSPFVAYQRDADIYRMHHLENYGALINEYHNKTGRYPFEGKTNKVVHVSFVTSEQADGKEVYESENVLAISQEDFRKEISKELGRDIRLWFDPQRVATNSPTYYLYVLEGDTYFFVVHLGLEYPFAAKRGKGFNQIEISNNPKDHPGFWKYEDIIKDPNFRLFSDTIPNKNNWLDHLDSKNM